MYKKSLSAITLNLTSLGGLITLLSTLVISIPSMTSPASALSCEFINRGCGGGGDRGSGREGVFGGGSIAPSGPGKPTREAPEKPSTSPTSPVNPPATPSANPSTKPEKYPLACSRKPDLPQCQ